MSIHLRQHFVLSPAPPFESFRWPVSGSNAAFPESRTLRRRKPTTQAQWLPSSSSTAATTCPRWASASGRSTTPSPPTSCTTPSRPDTVSSTVLAVSHALAVHIPSTPPPSRSPIRQKQPKIGSVGDFYDTVLRVARVGRDKERRLGITPPLLSLIHPACLRCRMEGSNSAGPLSPGVGGILSAAVGLGWMGRDGMWITLWNCAKPPGCLCLTPGH